MKLMWILCTCFVSFHQLVYADNETSTLATTVTHSEATSLSDVTTEPNTTEATITEATTLKEIPTTPQDINITNVSSTETPELPADTTPAPQVSTSVATEVPETTNKEPVSQVNSTMIIIKLSNQVRKILEHLQDANAVGLPGQNILPDPLPAPDVSDKGLFGNSEFYNITVHGMSNFSVDSVNMMLDQMTVYVKIRMKEVCILGNSTQTSGYFFTTKGPFSLTLVNVAAEGIVYLEVENDGSLHANRTLTTIKYDKMTFHFGEKSNAPLSSVVDAAGLAAIRIILPFIQARMDERLTAEVNAQLKSSPKFPAIRNISPVDLAISKGREYVGKNYDPYVVQNIINFDSDFFSLKVGPVILTGLSNFARVGDVSFGMANRTTVFKLRMITGKVHGESKFYINFGKMPQIPGRQGQANFSVDHLQFEAILHQPLNLKKKPYLQDLQLEVGPIKVQLDKQGNFDYFIELGIGHLPDFLRYYLIDMLEEPIKRKIQKDILDEVDVEEVVSTNLPLFEQLLLDTNKL